MHLQPLVFIILLLKNGQDCASLMFFNNGFNFARDLTITKIHGRCRPHVKSGFRSGFKDHNAPWLKTIHQFEDMISTTHSFKVVLTVTAPENVNIPHSHLGDLQICLFGGHQICLIRPLPLIKSACQKTFSEC